MITTSFELNDQIKWSGKKAKRRKVFRKKTTKSVQFVQIFVIFQPKEAPDKTLGHKLLLRACGRRSFN
jgi:hypothetical protein